MMQKQRARMMRKKRKMRRRSWKKKKIHFVLPALVFAVVAVLGSAAVLAVFQHLFLAAHAVEFWVLW